MGQHATPARNALLETITSHVDESAAYYAIMAIGKMDDNSQEVLESLQFAINAPNSVGRDEARKLYERLSGELLDTDAVSRD
jgi:hypothetical protein